ncbi:MAG: lytic transglycosylase domain-containing protein [Myxococcota bacterium]|nr:lytic transglycosylase domain-containing protein [Myxococcota bacterium]
MRLPPTLILIFGLAAALSLLSVRPLHAELCWIEQDGVVTLSSCNGRRGKPLPGAEERSQRRPRREAKSRSRAQRKSNPRRRSDPKRPRRLQATVQAAAQYYALPEALLWAVISVESAFNGDAVSDKGAQGLMQLMPGTAREMGVDDSFNEEQNIWGGARFLRLLANRFNGDMVLTVSAYHAGGSRVADTDGRGTQGIPYQRTAEYVRRVFNAFYRYQKAYPELALSSEHSLPPTP